MSAAEPAWTELTAFSDTFTCYSAAIATWLAHEHSDWPSRLNPGLWLAVSRAEPGLFGFAHFPPELGAGLGLQRAGSDDPEVARVQVLDELARHGRVIVAGDGYNLPWHVAYGRQHVPHWFVVTGSPDAVIVLDPFACRNELGNQAVHTASAPAPALAEWLRGLAPGDPVYELRERLALGDDRGPRTEHACQWFTHDDAGAPYASPPAAPPAQVGPDAMRALAAHFEAHAQDPRAYRQADDLWSIARHRAFLVRHAERTGADDPDVAAWLSEHGHALVKRWGHIAPLVMQATLSLRAGRSASTSVRDALLELAQREHAAGQGLPQALTACSIAANRGEGPNDRPRSVGQHL